MDGPQRCPFRTSGQFNPAVALVGSLSISLTTTEGGNLNCYRSDISTAKNSYEADWVYSVGQFFLFHHLGVPLGIHGVLRDYFFCSTILLFDQH